MLLRSNNEQQELSFLDGIIKIASVQYDGEAVQHALLVGSIIVVGLIVPGVNQFVFGMNINRFGGPGYGVIAVPGVSLTGHRIKFSTVLVTDLLPGDVIDCMCWETAGSAWALEARGFSVLVR